MAQGQLDLFQRGIGGEPSITDAFRGDVERFNAFGTATTVQPFPDATCDIPLYVNEFWTSKQRAAHSLHEVSYRACFKPQLPRFFIERLTQPGQLVYDPFMGRGTTIIEAALLGRRPAGCDVNPLSAILVAPRLDPPTIAEIEDRLGTLDLDAAVGVRNDLRVFFHTATLRAVTNLRRYLLERETSRTLDRVDRWIRMVATNRLTGHSPGFFSVYTLPPNQAVTVAAQQKINDTRRQVPPPRDVRRAILKKSRSLLAKLRSDERRILRSASGAVLLTASCSDTPEMSDGSVHLAVTSPPFLDTVDYQTDNWLRCWFNGIDAATVEIWQLSRPRDWQAGMARVFAELRRILIPGGHIAFEVGEIRAGRLFLETLVVPAAVTAGLTPRLVVVNDQAFTKTSQCWGVDNLKKGTNTNRIVLLQKPA